MASVACTSARIRPRPHSRISPASAHIARIRAHRPHPRTSPTSAHIYSHPHTSPASAHIRPHPPVAAHNQAHPPPHKCTHITHIRAHPPALAQISTHPRTYARIGAKTPASAYIQAHLRTRTSFRISVHPRTPISFRISAYPGTSAHIRPYRPHQRTFARIRPHPPASVHSSASAHISVHPGTSARISEHPPTSAHIQEHPRTSRHICRHLPASAHFARIHRHTAASPPLPLPHPRSFFPAPSASLGTSNHKQDRAQQRDIKRRPGFDGAACEHVVWRPAEGRGCRNRFQTFCAGPVLGRTGPRGNSSA
ncbi:hypothetical protein P7K49_012134 [Saguinus oedipus]|uniref:Uncharacterized protein n=1 Tax=Saguinus oedipus TaxID=9490 RepID=A0ABQ9VW60_SAGOE|nr:hypothetical protein P7K49_012134 [Saguinus oedipus]